jgi:hypothetical protein
MVKVRSLLKNVDKELDNDNAQVVANWIKSKKREIRSCQRTLNQLRAQLEKVLNKEVDDFADELLDEEFEY